MTDPSALVALTSSQFAAVIALFLPGFLSLRIDRLIHPRRDHTATEDVIDILGYSLLNAGVLSWAILTATDILTGPSPNYLALGLWGALICVIAPVAWPLAFRGLQRWAARRGWIMSPHRTAWDDFFSRKQPCWVVVHMADGSLVGGYFGERSIASVGTDAGHIYIEELWQLDGTGAFVKPTPETKGAIFRPTDYLWIEVKKDD